MWYTYDENSFVISKSISEPSTDSYAYMDEDIDLDIYNVIVGLVSEINEVPTITFVTKKLKSNYELANKIKEQQEKVESLTIENEQLITTMTNLENNAIDSELETDFRLSMLELGLA